MTAALPTSLQFGTVRWQVVGIAEDSADAGSEPDSETITGTVTFRPVVDAVKYVGQPGDPVPKTILPRTETYNLVSGVLKDSSGNADIKLVACDSPGTSPQGWQYLVEYQLNDGYTFGSFRITVLSGEIVDLTLALPQADVDGVLYTTGPAGRIAGVTVSSLPYGTPATVDNVGTPEDAIIEFGIPQGAPGVGVPAGGLAGQVVSSTGGGTAWSYLDEPAVPVRANRAIVGDGTKADQGSFKPLWHDLLAFSRHWGNPVYETSADGTTGWTNPGGFDPRFFNQKENQNIPIIDGTTVKAARWTWNGGNLQYCGARWLVIGHAYSGPSNPSKTVKVETSSDGVTWTTRHTSTYNQQALPVWHDADIGNLGDLYMRLTITHNSGSPINLASIRYLSSRWGDQGGGSENEKPYTWDDTGRIGTSLATPDTIVRRDGSGWFRTNGIYGLENPNNPDDAANKWYVDTGDTAAKARANHTGTQSADTLTDGATNKAFLATERTKLAGIATGATANSTDATLLARANHTGTQAATTITGLATVATSGLKADVGLGNVDNTSDVNKPVSTAQQTALDAKVARALTKNSLAGNYTLVASDALDKVLHTTSAAAMTITLPQDSAATIAQEIAIPWRQFAAGQITFVAGAGATLLSRGSVTKSAGQNAEGLLTKVAANTWLLSGDISA